MQVNYPEIVAKLGFEKICLGGCGISEGVHRVGQIHLDVVHWQDRRVNKRGLRRFLLLVAKRDRQLDPGFLNDERAFWWLYLYLDARTVDGWASELGVRFPVAYSGPERRTLSLIPGLSRRHPAVWAWARRGNYV